MQKTISEVLCSVKLIYPACCPDLCTFTSITGSAYTQVSSSKHGVTQLRDGCICISIFQLNKAESPGTSSFSIGDQHYGVDWLVLGEKVSDVTLGGPVGQITNVKLLRHNTTSFENGEMKNLGDKQP